MGLILLNEYEVPLVYARPPWRDTYIDETMMEEPLKIITDSAVQDLCREKTVKYENYIKVYTDGAKLGTEGLRGKTAATWVCSDAEPIVNKCMLPEHASNFGTEIYAIMGATEWYIGQECKKIW